MKEFIENLKEIIQYLLPDEKRNYEESNQMENHIYLKLKKLQEIAEVIY